MRHPTRRLAASPALRALIVLTLVAAAASGQAPCSSSPLSSYAVSATDIIGATGASAVSVGVPDYRFINDSGVGFGGSSTDVFDAGEVVELAFPKPLRNHPSQHDVVLSAFVGGLGATDNAYVQVEASTDGVNFTIIQSFNTDEARNRPQDLWENDFQGVKHFYLEFGTLDNVTHIRLTNLSGTAEGLRLDAVEGLHPVVNSSHAFEVRIERVREPLARRFKVRIKNIGDSNGVAIREWKMDRTGSLAGLEDTGYRLVSADGDFICFQNCVPDNHPTVIPFSRHVWSTDGTNPAATGVGLEPGRQAAHLRHNDFDTDGGVSYLASFTFTVTFTDGFTHTFDYDADVSKRIGSLYQQYLYFTPNPAQSWNRPVDYYEFVSPGPLTGAQWQVNTADAHLDIDGSVTTVATSPAAPVTKLPGQTFDITMQSSSSRPLELAITTQPVVAAGDGGSTTPGGQFVNVDVTNPNLIFLNGGAVPLLLPYPASLTASTPAPLALCSHSAQAAFVTPTSPDGLALTQASQLDVTPNASALATPMVVGDDTSDVRALGFGYSFYGTTYTEVYVGSNGYVTFGAPYTGFISSGTSLQNNRPIMAPCFADHRPDLQGTVSFYSNANSVFSVCWDTVSQATFAGTSTFSVTADAGAGTVFFDYGVVQARSAVAGIAPGNGSGTLLSLDLSAGPHLIGASDIPFEDFQHLSDLSHQTLAWTFAGGQPVSVQ